MLYFMSQVPQGFAEWLETQNQADVFPTLIHQVIYYILMAALISQFFSVALDFLGKSRTFKQTSPAQQSYYRGLGIFILVVAICQVMYLWVAVENQIYAHNIPLFKNASHYELKDDQGNYLVMFRSFMFFGEDKFIITFVLLFATLPFLTYPLERYIKEKKKYILTYASIIAAPAVLVIRAIEYYSIALFGIPSVPSTSGDIIFTGTWVYQISAILYAILIVILFTVILLLMNLYLQLGAKAPPGSKLRTKSKLVVIGLFFYVLAIVTTQNAAKQLITMSDPRNLETWGFLSYLFGYSTPIFLTITLITLRRGFNRDF